MKQENDFNKNQLEELYLKFRTNSNRTIIFYFFTLLSGIMTMVSNEYFDSFTYPVLILLFISLALFAVCFLNSYKTRYVFYKSINKSDKVDYKHTPAVFLLTCIPFLITNNKEMRKELDI